MNDRTKLTRRAFLGATTAAAFAAPLRVNAAKVVPRKVSPNEKLNVAAIGAGGKGTHDILSCRRENIVALCDVDHEHAGEAFYRVKGAKPFHDYRKMLESMPEIDAVTISTPDHTHAPAAHMAISLGKHVYVQKPMTHTVAEARHLRLLANEYGVATQMGNQGHSGKGTLELCEMIWDGAIGNVTQVHAWTDRPGGRWKEGVTDIFPKQPTPDHLQWDLWIGAGKARPYNAAYHPHDWRSFWDYGNGALGDMACHILDPANWALKLNDANTFTVEIVRQNGHNDYTTPISCVLKYSFPARGAMPPVDVYWYDGDEKPARPPNVPDDERIGDGDNGSILYGDKGVIATGTYGGGTTLLPAARMKDYTMPEETLERVPGYNHYRDWIVACKGGRPAGSNFDYAGPFTEMILVGNIALRLNRKLTYDAASMTIVNDAEATERLTKPYREGWSIPLMA